MHSRNYRISKGCKSRVKVDIQSFFLTDISFCLMHSLLCCSSDLSGNKITALAPSLFNDLLALDHL